MALGDVGGKVAVLRTFRVLRALKTVAVVPGKLSSSSYFLSLTDNFFSSFENCFTNGFLHILCLLLHLSTFLLVLISSFLTWYLLHHLGTFKLVSSSSAWYLTHHLGIFFIVILLPRSAPSSFHSQPRLQEFPYECLVMPRAY